MMYAIFYMYLPITYNSETAKINLNFQCYSDTTALDVFLQFKIFKCCKLVSCV